MKVYDGIVLAADSATTLPLHDGKEQVWNGANKLFHLHRDLPIALMTWGMGGIGDASIETLAKDLRRRLMGLDPAFPDWKLDRATYTMESVVDRFVQMFDTELFRPFVASLPAGTFAETGYLITGYGPTDRQSRAWEITTSSVSPAATVVERFGAGQFGWMAFAQPQAVERLFNGIDPILGNQIQAVVGDDVWVNQIAPLIQGSIVQPAPPLVPLADAIQLADFLAQVTAAFRHFSLGADTVGGMVDVAAISRHEGFRWVRRKHYYPAELNPFGGHHDH